MDAERVGPWESGARQRLVSAAPALLLALVALWEMVAAARAGHDVPGAAAWERAAAAVRADHRQDDLIVFAPGWIDPVGREHLGDLIPIDVAGRMDADRFGRIWELSIRGARAPETRGLAPVWRGDFGGVTVRRFEREPAVVLTDFVASFPAARVEGASARPPAARLEEVGFAPHRCVRVVPRPDGTVRVSYPAARLGSRLVGYVGLADVFTRREVRDPARLEVTIAGRPAASVTVGVDSGWVRFEAATEPGEAEVVFAATALGSKALDRLVCFAAEARQ